MYAAYIGITYTNKKDTSSYQNNQSHIYFIVNSKAHTNILFYGKSKGLLRTFTNRLCSSIALFVIPLIVYIMPKMQTVCSTKIIRLANSPISVFPIMARVPLPVPFRSFI